MRRIPYPEKSIEIFVAGEDPEAIWQNFRQWKGDSMMNTRTNRHRFGTGCTAPGCHNCRSPDCPYADFIRHYWHHPRCD